MSFSDKFRNIKHRAKSIINALANQAGAKVLPTDTGIISAASTAPGRSGGHWKNLKGLLRVLESANGAIAPFVVLIDQLIGCIDIYERAANGREDYGQLRSELESLFQELQGYFDQPVPPTITISMERLCRLVQQELKAMRDKKSGASLHRYPEEGRNSEKVFACYQRIHRYLQSFLLNINLSMWKNMDSLVMENRLNQLPASLTARFNSTKAVELKRGKCAQGTRTKVLSQLHNWIHTPGTRNLFWLNGMAGTGKTTIAYTLCAELDSDRKLAASFFCSRLLPECRDVNLIFPSIAYQLARASKPFQYALSQVLEKDPDVYARLPHIQFNSLTTSPLIQVRETLPENMVVVIDALDECFSKGCTSQMLDALFTNGSNLPLKFLVSSRPEPEIRDLMLNHSGDQIAQLKLHELEGDVVKTDIRTFLTTALAPMNLPESQIATLVERSGILFIYAATVVRFVGYDNFRRNPRVRLETVLNAPTNQGVQLIIKEIDQLYTTILNEAIDNPDLTPAERRDILDVLHTVICAREPLTVGALTGLLKFEDPERTHAALRPLWSVLHIANTGEFILTLHASFPDYILDSSRSQGYSCDPAAYSQTLAKLCFNLIRDTRPQFNICGLDSSFLPDEQVTNLDQRIRKAVSEELFYACQYWATHLRVSEKSFDLVRDLEDFLSTRLLLWMEIMNLKGAMHMSGGILKTAEKWVMDKDCTHELVGSARDSWRFVTTFTLNNISTSTPHIYVSMLPFWPPQNPVSKHYSSCTRGLVQTHGAAMNRPQFALLAQWKLGVEAESASFSSDGTRIVVGGENRVYVIDAFTSQTQLVLLKKNGSAICSVRFSPNDTQITACSTDGTICVWNGLSGREILGTHEGISAPATALDFSPNNSRIVSGSENGTINLWDPRTGQLLPSPFSGPVSTVTAVAFSSNGSLVAAGYDNAYILIWDSQTGKAVQSLFAEYTGAITSVSFSFDSTRIASGSFDALTQLWDIITGQLVFGPLKGHIACITSIRFSPDDKRIASGSADGSMCLRDTQSGDILAYLGGHTNSITSVAFSPDGAQIVSTASSSIIHIRDAHNRDIVGRLDGHASLVVSVDYSSSGTTVISGSYDGIIQLWHIQTGVQLLYLATGHLMLTAALSPDGSMIASGSSDTTIHVRDAKDGRLLLEPLKGHIGGVTSIVFSPDGTQIASGSTDMTICIWCVRDGRMTLGPLEGHSDWVNSVGFSPSGDRVVSGSRDKTMIVWSIRDGQIILGPLHGHTSGVTSVKFSPNDTCIASGSNDMTIRIWDARNGQILFGPLTGHTDVVNSVAFSNDGTWIASGSNDRTICVWDARAGRLALSPLKGHTNWVKSVAFSPDGTCIISGSDDKTVRIHDLRYFNLTKCASIDPSSRPGWTMNERGWIVDEQSRLLVWVPPDLRKALIWPHTTFLLSEEGWFYPDFDNALIGDSWAKCYTPP